MTKQKPVYYGIRTAAALINRSGSLISLWHAKGVLVPDAYTSTGYPLFLAATLHAEDQRHPRGTPYFADEERRKTARPDSASRYHGSEYFRVLATKSHAARRRNTAARAAAASVGDAA